MAGRIKPRIRKSARARDLLSRGRANKDVAVEAGLSKQRVSQIARASGRTREAAAAAIRDKIIGLADGTRTYRDIAAATRRTEWTVKQILYAAKRDGHPVLVRRATYRGKGPAPTDSVQS